MKKILTTCIMCVPMMVFGQQSKLNYSDRQDFQDATKGYIATWDSPEIRNPDGSISYTLSGWDFLKKECPATANPSLWRQSQLNRINGLFEVVPGKIYQIRGFDLANMTFVRTDNGWIVIDVTTSTSSAAAGYEMVKKHLGDLPIKAVIITHPHIDHYGGIEGIVKNAPNKDMEIITPKGFLKAAQEENVLAGVAMGRRASYMYGFQLPKNAQGNIGTGLGQTNAIGSKGMPIPTKEIAQTGEKINIDGLEMEFIFAPAAEAPVEIMIYFPQMKAFCVAEEINRTIHNLLTLRGAVVRNGLLWSKHIDTAIQKYGKEVEVSFSTHHWPTWGNSEIVKYWTAQRDLYRYLHDQTLNIANKGYTPNEIAEQITLPESIDTLFHCRGYYGSISHNVKSQYQMYFGWFDGNPANLNPLPPSEQGKKYVEAMGGADNVLNIAKTSFDKKEYRWCATLLNNLVFAEPQNQQARELLSQTYKQLGYEAESGPWRNFYLTGAQEVLKNKSQSLIQMVDTKAIASLGEDMLFDYLGIQINGKMASGKSATVNVHFTDSGKDVVMILSNGALSHRTDEKSDNADLSIEATKLDFVTLMTGGRDINNASDVKFTGNKDALNKIITSMDKADPNFNIVLP